MKVVINKCFGGFGLSEKAILWLANRNSSVIEYSTFEEYYGADEDGFVKKVDFVSDELITSMVPVADYHADRMNGRGHKPVEFNGKIVGLKDLELGIDDFEESKAVIRRHPDLVEVVEVLGSEANGTFADLVVVEIPDGVEYVIEEYDGSEHIAEKHRTWS